MDDDSLATVILFPLDRVRARASEAPASALAAEPASPEDYWAHVQRLAAQRRDLQRGLQRGLGTGAG